MPFATAKITLEIKYDTNPTGEMEMDNPAVWDWHTLIDLGPDESVRVVGYELIDEED